MVKKKRLLVLSAPMGSGHIRAAEALCQTYIKKFKGEAFHVDFLSYLNPKFSQFMEKGYYLMTKHTPIVYKFVYKNTDKPGKSVKTIGNFLNIKKYKELIEEYKPDFILSTHILPAAVVSWMYKRFPIVNGVVITDFVSHSTWSYPNNNRFFVACKEMFPKLVKMGVQRNKICVSGIPVSLNFSKSFDVEKLKKKFDLDLDKPVLLVMSGGNAIGPFIEILESLSKVKGDFQVLVMTGRNKKMYEELKGSFKWLGLKGKVLRFVNHVEEYMAVSDLLISKAGGLTVTEALTIGLPMLIIRPTPGQEDGNTEFLTEAGAAIYVTDIDDINLLIDDLLLNPEKITRMAENAKSLAKPRAAEIILKEMESVKKAPPKVYFNSGFSALKKTWGKLL